MSKPRKPKSPRRQQRDALREEAARLALGTQTPGQTKAETRAIARGIEKGIALYKTQQRDKQRARRKAHKTAARVRAGEPVAGRDAAPATTCGARTAGLLLPATAALSLLALAGTLFVDYIRLRTPAVAAARTAPQRTVDDTLLWHGAAARLEIDCRARSWRRVWLGIDAAARPLSDAAPCETVRPDGGR